MRGGILVVSSLVWMLLVCGARPVEPVVPPPVSASSGQAEGAEPDAALLERARKAAQKAVEGLAGAGAVPMAGYASYRRQPSELGIRTWKEVPIPVREGVSLEAWLVPPTRGKPRATLMVLHGWGSNIGFGLTQSAFLLKHGYQLFLVNARSNAFVGRASAYQGFLKEDLADLELAYRVLIARPEVDPERVGLYGFSWGAAKVLLAGAAQPGFKAVIADAAPLSHGIALSYFEERMPPAARQDRVYLEAYFQALDALFVARLGYPFRGFDVPHAAAGLAPRPLLLIHSLDDGIVPVDTTRLIAASAPGATVYIGSHFGHCLGMQRAPKEYSRLVVGFLDQVFSRPRAGTRP